MQFDNLRKTLVTYGFIRTSSGTSLTYFKIKLNQLDNKNCLEGYMSDIDHPELPTYLQSMGSDPKFVSKLSKKKYNSIGIICNLNIEFEHRGQGFGTMLIESAIDEFCTLNADVIILVPDIHKSNSHLQNGLEQWYKNRGFETIGRKDSIPLMTLTNVTKLFS